jgi:hypothetical protein
LSCAIQTGLLKTRVFNKVEFFAHMGFYMKNQKSQTAKAKTSKGGKAKLQVANNAAERMQNCTHASLQDLRDATVDMDMADHQTYLAGTLDPDMTNAEKACLTVVQRVLREHHDIDTPVEHFIVNLISTHGSQALSRSDISREFEEFEMNWRDSLRTARTFYRNNRALVTGDALPRDEDRAAERELAAA